MMPGLWSHLGGCLKEVMYLVSGRARQESEAANQRAHQRLEHEMCSRGVADGLSEIDRLMRKREGELNGHHKPAP